MRKLIAVLIALVIMLSAAGGLGEAGAEPGSGKTPEPGAVIQGFEVVEKRDFRMADAELVLFEHQKTGAKVMYIANEDTNRAFQLTFLTRPLDDTGLPHVFEHATLYGSEKLTWMRQRKAVTPETVRESAEAFRKLVKDGYRGTAAGAGTVQENAELFEAILNPFGAADAEKR